MGKKYIVNLCDSLLENLYNKSSFSSSSSSSSSSITPPPPPPSPLTTTTTTNNNNNNDDKLDIWKEYRTNPEIVLKIAYENMSIDQKHFFNLVTNYGNNNNNNNNSLCQKKQQQQQQIHMLAGLPGTGKSFLQTCINLFFKTMGKEVLCLAPTNFIAHKQKGITIHKVIFSLCHQLNIKHFKCDNDFIDILIKQKYQDICNMSLTQLCKCIENILKRNGNLNKFVQILSDDIVILIDEGTMVSSTLFSLLYYTYPNAKYVIMYGPNQLPPPIKVKGINMPSCDECIIKQINQEPILFYELQSQMRFNKDSLVFIEFVQYFSDVLSGKMIKETTMDKLNKLEYFFKNLEYGGSLKDYRNLTGDSKRILIVSTNEQRCRENDERLRNEGEGPIYRIPAQKPLELPDTYDLPSRIGIDNVLSIRKGVYCMVRINDLSRRLIKGQIVRVDDIIIDNNNGEEIVDYIVVYNLDTEETIYISKVEIATDYPSKRKKQQQQRVKDDDDDDEDDYLTITQFPITLSYSLTAHSAQGKTLNCNIGIQLKHYNNNNINSYFVALTRVCDSKQIFMNFHPASLLYFDMNIKSIKDVEKMKKDLYGEDTTFHLSNFVNNFSKRKLPLLSEEEEEEEKIMSFSELQNINSIIKKIC